MLVPDETRYRTLLDGLLDLYRDACRVKQDRRYGKSGRQRKVSEFETRLWELVTPAIDEASAATTDTERDFRNLCHELMKLMMWQELFVFVTSNESVTGTNNEMEQALREPALCRRTGQTSRTPRGARRRTVIVTFLESCRRTFKADGVDFTLDVLLKTVTTWMIRGRSIFREKTLASLAAAEAAASSCLDDIYNHAATSAA